MFILMKALNFLLCVIVFVSAHLFNFKTHANKAFWLIAFAYDTHYVVMGTL